jgi:hypothetical protein
VSIEKVTHRGISWQRDSQGRIRWWNDDKQRWVRWHPGDDAPPRPQGWDKAGGATPPPLTRPAWRSPYRLIPVALVIVVLGLGLYQAFGSGGSATTSASETSQAEAYAGKCLPKANTAADAGYSSTPVACSSAGAAGKVVEVVTWEQSKTACPPDTVAAILTNSGVTHPHLECIQPLAGR